MTIEARKIERKFLGPVAGAAIKLDADEDVLGGLHIGEGIETCLAARMLGTQTRLGARQRRRHRRFPRPEWDRVPVATARA